MIIPQPLLPGSKISIISTASKTDAKLIIEASEILQKEGFIVSIGKFTGSAYYQFSGTDAQRFTDLQTALDDPTIDAIICSRGGYGTLRTIIGIDWTKFVQKPKWIVGFSDITVLHSQLNQLKVASVHGVMPRYFAEGTTTTKSFQLLIDALLGKPLSYPIPINIHNKTGVASAEVVGGNLSILYSLRGTHLDIDTIGKILFIEDLSEYLYHIDRMLLNLKIGRKLEGLAGLIVGGFTGMKDNDPPFGKNIEEIILDALEPYNYPVMFDFPAGHQKENYPIMLGINATMEVSAENSFFKQEIINYGPTH